MVLSATFFLPVRGWGFSGITRHDHDPTRSGGSSGGHGDGQISRTRRFFVNRPYRPKRTLATRIGARSHNGNGHAIGEKELHVASLLKRIEELEAVVALGEVQRKKPDGDDAAAAAVDLVAKEPVAVSAASLGTSIDDNDSSTAATTTTTTGDDALAVKKQYQVSIFQTGIARVRYIKPVNIIYGSLFSKLKHPQASSSSSSPPPPPPPFPPKRSSRLWSGKAWQRG